MHGREICFYVLLLLHCVLRRTVASDGPHHSPSLQPLASRYLRREDAISYSHGESGISQLPGFDIGMRRIGRHFEELVAERDVQDASPETQTDEGSFLAIQGDGCPRTDGRRLSVGDLSKLSMPTVITNLVDDSAPHWFRQWRRDDILQRFGATLFSPDDLDHNGAGAYLLDMMEAANVQLQPSLEQILEMDQPGNVFIGNSQMLTALLHDAEWSSPLVSDLRAEAKLSSLSMGSKGQWNELHIHPSAFFMQIQGSKSWIFTRADTFPERLTDLPDNNRIGDWLISQEDICGSFGHHGSRGKKDVAALERMALVQNLSKRALQCRTQAGEAIFIPGQHSSVSWWHGTCGVGSWNAGFSLLLRSDE